MTWIHYYLVSKLDGPQYVRNAAAVIQLDSNSSLQSFSFTCFLQDASCVFRLKNINRLFKCY